MTEDLSRQEGQDDPSLVIARVLDEAQRVFGGYDEAFLARIVRDAVADLWGESIRVTSFVPVLAMRQVREAVETRAATCGGLGTDSA